MSTKHKAILCHEQALLKVGGNTNTFDAMAKRHTSDAQELAARVRAAIKASGADVSTIARECDITSQAVHGWMRTGRISKKHLPVLAKHTGQSVDYFIGAAEMTAQEQDEVDLVLAYRALPPEFQQKLRREADELRKLAGKPGRKPPPTPPKD